MYASDSGNNETEKLIVEKLNLISDLLSHFFILALVNNETLM